jgi:NAD(P)-dependent dehydrogenase (short-subunit alcohol dehydrogenase family)
MATVLILGASRGIGLEAVKAALRVRHSVRALARSARSIPVNHPKLEKVTGDALQMTTVKRCDRRGRCSHPVAWHFGRTRNHSQADAVFLHSNASARRRDGGGPSQAVDLRDGKKRWTF